MTGEVASGYLTVHGRNFGYGSGVSDDLEIRPLSSDRSADLFALLGERSGYWGCWCQWFRVTNAGYQQRGSVGNKAAMTDLIADERTPGLLAYRDGAPVGWVSIAPRREFERIAGDPETAMNEELAQPEASPVWSVTCFVVSKTARGTGIARSLLAAAIDFAREQGAQVVEAYPVEPNGRTSADNAFIGVRSMYENAGFEEVGRFDRWRGAPPAARGAPVKMTRPPGRPVMRLVVGDGSVV
ncbi:MAG: GNAT family N-acetyltransferase [Candidatus Limnocylindrales bacterium]